MDGVAKTGKRRNSKVFHNDGTILLPDEIEEIYNCNSFLRSCITSWLLL